MQALPLIKLCLLPTFHEIPVLLARWDPATCSEAAWTEKAGQAASACCVWWVGGSGHFGASTELLIHFSGPG